MDLIYFPIKSSRLLSNVSCLCPNKQNYFCFYKTELYIIDTLFIYPKINVNMAIRIHRQTDRQIHMENEHTYIMYGKDMKSLGIM